MDVSRAGRIAPSMYERLAASYDNDLRDEFSRVCADTAARHLQGHGILPPAQILDLACGTGLTAYHLQDQRYRVTGIDASQDMLAIARARVPASGKAPRFLHGDIRALPDFGPFSAALCFGDVLNHLLQAQDVLAMLKSVHSVLAPGGWLIGDTNTLETYRSKMWNNELPPNSWGDLQLRKRSCFDEDEGLGHMECQIYQPGKAPEVHILTERYHPPETVTGWLEQAGFADVQERPFNPLDVQEAYPGIRALKTLWTARKL